MDGNEIYSELINLGDAQNDTYAEVKKNAKMLESISEKVSVEQVPPVVNVPDTIEINNFPEVQKVEITNHEGVDLNTVEGLLSDIIELIPSIKDDRSPEAIATLAESILKDRSNDKVIELLRAILDKEDSQFELPEELKSKEGRIKVEVDRVGSFTNMGALTTAEFITKQDELIDVVETKATETTAQKTLDLLSDSARFDAFSRLRVSTPSYVFDGQLTYDLQPLLFEQITTGTGATVTHDTTNRMALMTFASTPTGGKAIMQSFEHFRYTAGRSQLCFITFNMKGGVTNVLKFAGYSDGVNGIEFQLNGTTKQFTIYSSSSAGNETVTSNNWNLDKLDGTGASGMTLDTTKTQILVIDFQALYVGRVRIGFDMNGTITYCHEFDHANLIEAPYIATANLPVRVGMTSTGIVSTTMNFICTSIIKEDGGSPTEGYQFTQDTALVTAGNGVRTHALSIQPRLTFNSITNRAKFILESVALTVTGNNPVHWELCIGDVLTGSTTFTNSNTTYSAMDYNTAATTSGNPAIILACGFVASSNQAKGAEKTTALLKYPICLDAAGAVRPLGRLTLLVNGLGAASACYGSMTWTEIR